MHKKAAKERELEPPQQQRQHQRQQKGEKVVANKRAGRAFAGEGARTPCEQHRATTLTHPVPRALHGGRCTAGSRCNRVPQASMVCVRWSGEGGSKQ